MIFFQGKKSRVIEYLFTIWVIFTLNFFLPRTMPGDPFLFISADEEGEEVAQFSEEQRNYYMAYYGLDRPLYSQYFSYFSDLSKGYLGYSLYYNQPVTIILLHRLPWTLCLVMTAVILSTVIGIVLGGFCAVYADRWEDRLLYFMLIAISEIPAFLVGLVLLFFFAAGMGLFPLSGAMTHFSGYDGFMEKTGDILHHAALPVIALTLTRISGIFLLTRSSIITVLTKTYIKTARAKGISGQRIFIKHIFRNAMLPIVTRVFLSLGSLVGGAILVENVFAYPGLGKLMRDAVMMHDYPLIQGIFLMVTISVLSANFIADLVYKKLDPRISDAAAADGH
ncbi:MAG: ABC transporter permease [Desulfobacula sp.]|nr:ABC transporter permease [Desulfobacula sp.]